MVKLVTLLSVVNRQMLIQSSPIKCSQTQSLAETERNFDTPVNFVNFLLPPNSEASPDHKYVSNFIMSGFTEKPTLIDQPKYSFAQSDRVDLNTLFEEHEDSSQKVSKTPLLDQSLEESDLIDLSCLFEKQSPLKTRLL